ncbi:MAG TPA: phage tail sheath C-terminal domain-containing protein [Kofleriaceae bacterium]|nr:phage tail sheath C-terminal domain-containing protein [Kofleriaceae bacterium]
MSLGTTNTHGAPDLHLEDLTALPPVVEVGTALPIFIGYTQIARRLVDDDLLQRPTKIASLSEYESMFGLPSAEPIAVDLEHDGQGHYRAAGFTAPRLPYLLYYAVRLYFANGGAQCYVVSAGRYRDAAPFHEWEPAAAPPAAAPATRAGRAARTARTGHVARTGLRAALEAASRAEEPTLIVMPEAVHLGERYGDAVQAVLAHCERSKNRFAILDVQDGTADLLAPGGAALEAARAAFGGADLSHGAAYYPFVKTSLHHHVDAEETNVAVTIAGASAPVTLASLATSNVAAYQAARAELSCHFVVVPPSGAVAGVYAATAAARGVWHAPANVTLADVLEPAVRVSHAAQKLLDVDPAGGRSINALRAFTGQGTLVAGTRTLAGNDPEWRHVSVRRFCNLIEASVRQSTAWVVREPNDESTWLAVCGMLECYLTDKWRDGALDGATPQDAFYVRCGLGTTMTALDILQGRLHIEIGMSITHRTERVVFRVSHRLRRS